MKSLPRFLALLLLVAPLTFAAAQSEFVIEPGHLYLSVVGTWRANHYPTPGCLSTAVQVDTKNRLAVRSQSARSATATLDHAAAKRAFLAELHHGGTLTKETEVPFLSGTAYALRGVTSHGTHFLRIMAETPHTGRFITLEYLIAEPDKFPLDDIPRLASYLRPN